MNTYLYSQHFNSATALADFVNQNNIAKADILKVDADAGSGGWVMWWYGPPPA